MFVNKHKAARERKKDNMKLKLSRSKCLEGSVCSLITKAEFDKYSVDYLTHKKVIAIYEGTNKILIIYGGV